MSIKPWTATGTGKEYARRQSVGVSGTVWVRLQQKRSNLLIIITATLKDLSIVRMWHLDWAANEPW